MISIRWLEKRKPHWARLEQLVQVSSRGVRALRHSELQELGLLYRQTASDLAAVREDPSCKQLATYLNQLLGRSHNLIYHGHKAKVSGIVRFYGETYPRVFRETLPPTLLSLAIFAVTGLAAWMVTIRDPGLAQLPGRRGWLCSSGVLLPHMACWNCPRYLFPEAPEWRSLEAFCSLVFCQDGYPWHRPVAVEPACCWGQFLCS